MNRSDRDSTTTTPRPSRKTRLRPTLSLLVLSLLGWSLASTAFGAVYRVGSNAVTCDHTDLKFALLAAATNPGMDTILLSRDQTYTGNYFVESSVEIRGGYDNCVDFSPSGRTTVFRSQTERAFTVQSAAVFVALKDLEINFGGGTASTIARGGMIYLAGAGNSLELSNTVVSEGRASHGGGIYVSEGLLGLNNHSIVTGNYAAIGGGGIYCELGGVVQVLAGGIKQNSSSGFGGGLAFDACTGIALRSQIGEGIVDNTAVTDGGGVHLTGGADFDLAGNGSQPAVVAGNSAARGGGFFAEDPGTDINARNAHIVYNQAVDQGGGVFLGQFGFLLMERTLDPSQCHATDRCSSLSGNSVTSPGGTGGAVHNDRGYASIYQTYVETNSAADGGAISLDVGDSQLTLEGTMVTANTATSGEIVNMGAGSKAWVRFSTFARNTAGIVFNGPPSTLLQLVSSIVQDGLVHANISPGFPATIDCVLHDQDTNIFPLPGTVTRVRRHNPALYPLFVDAAGSDYHLAPLSEAQEFCDTSVYFPVRTDIDLEPRLFSDPDLSDWWGPYDVGADERHQGTPLFADGFESGDTTAWTP